MGHLWGKGPGREKARPCCCCCEVNKGGGKVDEGEPYWIEREGASLSLLCCYIVGEDKREAPLRVTVCCHVIIIVVIAAWRWMRWRAMAFVWWDEGEGGMEIRQGWVRVRVRMRMRWDTWHHDSDSAWEGETERQRGWGWDKWDSEDRGSERTRARWWHSEDKGTGKMERTRVWWWRRWWDVEDHSNGNSETERTTVKWWVRMREMARMRGARG
jgi:hypothetical protein